MIGFEVRNMEEERLENEEIAEQESVPYRPRPLWQRLAAWIGAGIVLIAFLLYVWQIANGGV